MAPQAGFAVTMLGYAAATLTTLSFFPQALKTLRGADVSGISLRTYGLLTIGIAAWAVYGLLLGDGPLIVANLITLFPASVVLERRIQAQLRLGNRQQGRRVQPPPGGGG
jgi:MtN3 and saliva related transmembrane protein